MACFNLENSPKSRRHVSLPCQTYKYISQVFLVLRFNAYHVPVKAEYWGFTTGCQKISPDGRFHGQDIQSIH